MRATGLYLSVLLLFCVGSLNATTIHVPADQPTIQAGIDAAVDGDTVLVADGTYTGDGNRDIDFLGKAIVVMSENGPENCVIDCEGSFDDQHRGFYFHSGEESRSVVQGFTITKGYYDYGGGFYCINNSSPTVTRNTITGNTADERGGGIYCLNNSSPTISNNTISGNTTAFQGGGISCWDSSSPTITGNTISGNTAAFQGGAILCWYSSPTITGNTISGNTAATGAGGGIFDGASSSVITGNIITGNAAGGELYTGGGIVCWLSSSIIEDNTISGNTADWGGGIAIHTSFAVISNNTVTNNAADSCGGGIDFYYGSATMANNTIVYNYAAKSGGGIQCEDSCVVTATNAIVWNNDAPIGEEIYIGYYLSPPVPSTLTILYSDVEGGEEGVFVDTGCTLNWGEGMIDDDPMFVLPDKHDWRLLWQSPCIDYGHPDSLDADGTRSDMGAHYFNQDDYLTLYLTPDATEVLPGDELGVTYTAMNRWDSPESCWLLSQACRSGGSWFNLLGPDDYTLPANFTAQVHITHPVPDKAPAGIYEYRSLIGMPPGTLYDQDSFSFRVVE